MASVDALRGWAVAAMLLVNYPGDWGHVYAPLRHSEWNGCTPTDLIFPTFLFLVGVSIALSMARIVDAAARRDALGTSWLRALRLILLGGVLHGLAMWAYDTPHFRVWGVLQRIGLCFGVAASAMLYLRARGQWVAIAAIMIGYTALLEMTGGSVPLDNIASRIDSWMLGPHAYRFDAASGRGHDPEGLSSTLPAIATTLIGIRAGAWLRGHGTSRLLLAGGVALSIGWLWSFVVPWNKNLWTPSFVAWSAGWAMLLLVLCHRLFDVRGWPPFGRSMGINAIVAYAGSWAMACLMEKYGLFGALYRDGFQPLLAPTFGDEAASFAFAAAFVAFWCLLMWAMQRKGWRIVI